MRSRARYVTGLILAAALTLAACGGDQTEQTEQTGIQPPSEVTGVITVVEPATGEVEGFVLKTENGGSLEIKIDREVDYGFDLEHLREHMGSGDPVAVDLEGRDGAAYALSIEDV